MPQPPRDPTPPPDDASQPAQPMGIADAARAADVPRQTIEYYILLGLVQPERPEGKRKRLFTAEHVRRIRLIHELNKSGYTLRDIREIYLK